MKKEQKNYTRMEIIKEEFNLSATEVDEIQKFLSRPELLGNKNVTLRYIIESIIETDDLNSRQKVILAYSIGIFQMERGIERNVMPIFVPTDHIDDKFRFMKGG